MTRYFIDTSDGETSLSDEIGADYATEGLARSEALQAVGDMARDHIHKGGNREMKAAVRDSTGTVVYAVRLSLTNVTIGS